MRTHSSGWLAFGLLSVTLLGCSGSNNKIVEATNKITAIETAINQPPYGGPSKGEMGKGASGSSSSNSGPSSGGPSSGGPSSGGPSKGPPGKPN